MSDFEDRVDFRLPLREDLKQEAPYGAPQIAAKHLLNVNENPFGPSAAMIELLKNRVAQAAIDLNRYPDREFLELRQRLGEYLSLDQKLHGRHSQDLAAEQIWVANGSNEVMQQIFQAFGGPGRKALGFSPHYAMYPEYARNTLTEWVYEARSEGPEFSLEFPLIEAAIAKHRPTLVILTSPNNPTGTQLDLATIASVAQLIRKQQGILIVDEAYAEFRRNNVPSAVEILAEHPNLIITRTMSKAFALAGARIGYLAASKAVIDALRIVKLPYHLSSITQAVGLAALDSSTELLSQVEFIRNQRDEMALELKRRGYQVADSDANFIYFGEFNNRHEVWEKLLAASVLIREVGPPGWLRVSVGNRENNEAFLAALANVR